MKHNAEQVWNTCGYVRLSREDGDKEESNSVTGQKDLIRDYMTRHPELRECGMKVDDGFTGSNFDRPAFQELMARIRCITRRPRKMAFGEAVSCGDLSYDVSENRLNGPQGNCSLSRREGMLLETFLRNPSQTLSRSQLLTKVWGPDSDVEDGNLDNYIHFLRRRLQAVGSSLKIQTVRGVGYRLQQP